ncbi:DHH family phosphoesterase [Mesoplasma corruscae]|uniref:Bifunctional oligoribonuclease and PAP phosphatase NrnA n=1 Tax=Mesoplasma corruscae TaxID=216874 RepID=A0A2S5RFV4_9MOLU|nr:bifunctional oligoribonuclease/PAP phosphatase NrnA [Mesoplasma corruscae]PPE06181.1 bifunctional oligoribonuclease and PAP phosphatase NrnA [Mesoplasma corruscae]
MELISKIVKAIEEHKKIILLRHIQPDGDAYGSQLGLKELIKTNYPTKEVYAFGEEVNYLKFIGNFDQMENEEVFNGALVIVTDCGNVERIDNQNYNKGKTLIKIDHHPDATPYGDISWVDTTFTSASEMIGLLAIQAKWIITPQAGKVIYHGICTDSGRFAFGGITSRTFQVCSDLLNSGFDIHELYKSMYKKNFQHLKLQAEVMQTANVTLHGVGYSFLTKELMEKYEVNYDDNGKFSNLLKDIENVHIWLSFSARIDGKWRVEFRSTGVPINELAIKWGGGGHLQASGAIVETIEDCLAIVEEANQLLAV